MLKVFIKVYTDECYKGFILALSEKDLWIYFLSFLSN